MLTLKRALRFTMCRGSFVLLCACGAQTAFMPASQPPPVRPSLGFPSLGLAQTSHSAFTEFLGINDLGDIAATAGEGKALVAYVGRAPYRSVDFKRKALPGAVTTIVTALNNAG